MPPSGYSHLLSHKDFIITLHQQNRTHQDIISHLKQDYNLEVSRSTLSRCLRKWNIRKYKKWEANDEIQILIKELFSRGLQDADILLIIKEKHPDSQLCIRQLRQIRQQFKLPQRRDNYESDEVKSLYQLDRLFKTVQLLDPDGIKRRLNDLQRHRGSYIVPGPNYLWSIDGYCKLQHWGIEIYAAIDAYSRYIVWIYIGITNRTAVSVLRQFLDVLQATSTFPQIIRSDRGTETSMIAAAQLKLHQATDSNTSLK
ncbi:hypothetical protein PABG_12476 [Paracoccidioides brasiliensis Pb03]|nr:hypothetical protein PABG_12476 [Paracoccidioides brasiliensis Pb03]